ncbi:exported hypothetical protein [Bradyrhizobium sp. STM 3809]|nr:exported hypothetical protein [Bradyrhizobium sp. STM 3809]
MTRLRFRIITGPAVSVIPANAAKQSRVVDGTLDCFAPLAVTIVATGPPIPLFSSTHLRYLLPDRRHPGERRDP